MTARLAGIVLSSALAASFASAAHASTVSFSFVGTAVGVPVQIETGVTMPPESLLAGSDTMTDRSRVQPGTPMSALGAPSINAADNSNVAALFTTGPGVEVEVPSASCAGPAISGLCVDEGNGAHVAYSGFANSTGSFEAQFHVDYIGPYVSTPLGTSGALAAYGESPFSTSPNSIDSKSGTAAALLDYSGISFQSIPEPGALVILGAGILGIASLIRKRRE